MTPDLFLRIEDYFDNTLTPEERRIFEEQMQADPEFAQSVALVREMRERLGRHWTHESADAALMETLRQIGQEYFKGTALPERQKLTKSIAIFSRIVQAAAAMLVLAIAAWFFILRPPKHERLYAQYKAFPEASFTTRNVSAVSLLEEASRAFNERQYEEALTLFERYLEEDPNNTEVRYFAGLCLIEIRRYDEARKVFAQIMNIPAWADEAHWYTALAYLRENRIDECRRQLAFISAGGSRYAQARQLLEQLNR
ncbi:MAG: tetratricopeptide repeat protein [Saprospiraceae bacterium]|nr:tetratricopeptide repeat protein [Saprospiraceae bacterium]MDW8483983.1 tetratricopeptide repeat protein [Saprospiraceae bacterium]